jgi:hypothetical protein
MSKGSVIYPKINKLNAWNFWRFDDSLTLHAAFIFLYPVERMHFIIFNECIGKRILGF